jgi:hypothetical protein
VLTTAGERPAVPARALPVWPQDAATDD